MLSVFCLLLYSAGLIRNELKFKDYDERMKAVEEVIPKLREQREMTKTSNEGRMSKGFKFARVHSSFLYYHVAIFRFLFLHFLY